MVKDLNQILKDINDKKYWYFGNHNKDFIKMCYIVDLLDQMSPDTTQKELDKIRNEFNSSHSNIKLHASMFKSMISSKLYGLLDNSNRTYVKCNPTPVFRIIKDRTSRDYKNTDLYLDIIEQQIEKIYCITPFFRTKGKEEIQLYPLFFLYKVLVEIGKITGNYKISDVEFNYFVSTSNTYSEWKNVVDSIIYYRELNTDLTLEIDRISQEKKINPPDQRYNQIISILPQFRITRDYYKLRKDYINTIKDKVAAFELVNSIPSGNPGSLPNGLNDFKNYIQFLNNNSSMLPKL
ncbi:hypothetical protein JCM16358_25300 [Halanaerocella petrolearia]